MNMYQSVSCMYHVMGGDYTKEASQQEGGKGGANNYNIEQEVAKGQMHICSGGYIGIWSWNSVMYDICSACWMIRNSRCCDGRQSRELGG